MGTFLDNFDDGDFSGEPAWSLDNGDDRPGAAEVIDGAVRLTRSGAGSNGGAVAIEIPVDIPVDWVRDIDYRLHDAFPAATRVTGIRLFSKGWDFDGRYDNIRIASPRLTVTPMQLDCGQVSVGWERVGWADAGGPTFS